MPEENTPVCTSNEYNFISFSRFASYAQEINANTQIDRWRDFFFPFLAKRVERVSRFHAYLCMHNDPDSICMQLSVTADARQRKLPIKMEGMLSPLFNA